MFGNANLPNSNQNRFTGDIVASLTRLMNHISRNSGVRKYIRKYNISEKNCDDLQCPFVSNKGTNISLVSAEYDFTQFEDTSIIAEGTLRVRSDKGFASMPGVDCQRIFIGLKNSIELIRQMRMFHNNKDTGYNTADNILEGHLYATNKPRSSKIVHKHTHSLWENVSVYDDSICGVTFNPVQHFPTPDSVTELPVTFIIPILDFAILQLFPDWARSWGDIVLRLDFSTDAFVTAQIEPHEVAKTEYLINDAMTNANLNLVKNTEFQYNRKFNQINIPGEFITNVTAGSGMLNYVTEEVLFQIENLTFNSFRTVICGYDVDDATRQAAITMFPPENPLIILGQRVEVVDMPAPSNKTQYNASKSIVLNNVTDITPVFRKDSRQITCYENPMVNNLQFFVDTNAIPSFRLCTIGPAFFELSRKAADLDDLHPMTIELEESLTVPLNNPDGTPIRRMKSDQTNFLPTIPTERKVNGYVFDGIETGSSPVTFRMMFSPIYQGPNDVYLDKTPCAPQVFLTRDVFCSLDMKNGLQYYNTGTPMQYASTKDSQISPITGNPRIA